MISIAGPCPARHDSSLLSDHLSSSQLPVWTIYAEKICVPTTSDLECQASWAFEMVSSDQRECSGNTKIFSIVADQTQRLPLLAKMCQKCSVFCSNWARIDLSLRDIAGASLPPRPPGRHREGHHGACQGPGRVQNKVQGRTKICLQVKYFWRVNINILQTNINNIYEHNFLKPPNLQSYPSPVGLDLLHRLKDQIPGFYGAGCVWWMGQTRHNS